MTETSARVMQRAGIAHFTLHDLRPTFTNRLVMVGIDLTTVKGLMGHKHITMTPRYAHPGPGHKRSAIAVLERLVEQVLAIFTTDPATPTPHLPQVTEK